MEAYYDECKKDRLLINGKKVLSFFKVMIVETFLEVLCFPSKFARSVPHLTDRVIYLEDSCGRQWMTIVDGPNFAEHDMKVGEFLVFHYVPDDQHFIVQIFRTSDCEKINYDNYICKGKQNERTY
ncbi:hypothetical protein H5410_061922 [Solanum commersonii]|uniref:TF-B3 domain-containing protein n=1 Tax=Solanum commersonii TaxID=4109 RepID=A0A9J5WA68_SOLCO|nr:hypothetical protein H5410_061922 [Solanum commersonii]